MNQTAVGFYWTLPVPWAGFTTIPDNVEAAAAASRTIRYQRELVRRHATAERWVLADEVVFLEMQPDRGTEMVRGPLDRAARLCRKHGAILLTVDFGFVHGWRGHHPLHAAIETLAVEHRSVAPDPVMVDGRSFDPFEHFAEWRAKQEAWSADKATRQAVLIREGRALCDQGLSHARVAKVLNDRGFRSATGKALTAESVRKAIRTVRAV